MGKGDNSAFFPGLAAFLADARGEVKEIKRELRDLEKLTKKAGGATQEQLQRMTELERRQTALKYQVKNDAELKRVESDVKFLRGIAIGQGVRSILSGKFSPTDLAQIFLQPGVTEAIAKKLQRAGKVGALANTRAGGALRAAGGVLGFAARAALPVAIAAEVGGAVASALNEKLDEREEDFVRHAENRQRRMALQRRALIDEETLAAIRGGIEPEADNIHRKWLTGAVEGRSDAELANTEAAVAKVLEKVVKRVAQARGLDDFQLNSFSRGTQLENLNGNESEKERDALIARLALSKVFGAKLDALLADRAKEAKRQEEHRRTASPSQLYLESVNEQKRILEFQMRRTIEQPSWLPERVFD